jgi:lysozyme family protein
MAYSPRFLAFLPFIFKWEGGYDNDPDDPGGETKYGIDKRSHPTVDIKALTKAGATEIYWREYWQKNECEDLPAKVGEVYFNACVNCGAGRAKKLLHTLTFKSVVRGAGKFLDEQEAFYRRLVAAKPDLKKFQRGWLNRTADLRITLGL